MTSEVISASCPIRWTVPRADHPISRRNIDPDALRVLFRLQRSNHAAYLVGGSVQDLMLGRVEDFDVATDAHPYPDQAALPELLDHRPPVGLRT